MSDLMVGVLAGIVTGLFGYLRFVVPVSGGINKADIFKDLAHIWVGVLIGAGFYDHSYWVMATIITILEVVAFFVRKKQ